MFGLLDKKASLCTIAVLALSLILLTTTGYIWQVQAQPGNDDFDNAIIVTTVPYSNTQNVITATTAADDPVLPCEGSQKYNTVWYRYTPSVSDTLMLSTFGSDYGTVLAVWTGTRGSLTSQTCSQSSQVQLAVDAGTTYHIEIARSAGIIVPPPTSLNLVFTVWPANAPPGAFDKSAPANGAADQSTRPILSWDRSIGETGYAYCYDTSSNNSCDTSWTTTSSTSAVISGLSLGTTYYWQVRATNNAGTTDADGGAWWSFTTVSATDLAHWTGTTRPVWSASRPMSFDVLTDGTQWLHFTLSIDWQGCGSSGGHTIVAGGPGTITNNRFSYYSNSFEFGGTFTSTTTASGYFDINNYFICVPKLYGCCWFGIDDNGKWTASGPPLTPERLYLPLVLRSHY